VRVALIYLKKK